MVSSVYMENKTLAFVSPTFCTTFYLFVFVPTGERAPVIVVTFQPNLDLVNTFF